ncbi:MAG: chemotaxis protein MotB [Nitrospinaceae bacterium]|nr:MAG: chemotaxis protein MotB [Nitrospinaceae bacterium]
MAEEEEKKKKEPDPAEEEEEEEEEGGGAPAWVMTFADLVTLLMVFFILLFAMGSIEDEKWRLIKESLKSALGTDVLPEAGTRQGLDVISMNINEESINAIDEVGAMVAKEIEEIASEVEEFVYKNKLSGQVEVSSDERGAVITISDVVLFPPGQARISPKGTKVIHQVFDLLNQFHYDVKIEGHTDDTPIRTARFPSNWELSASRAADVARLFVESGFSPENLSIEGLAEFRPKLPNINAKNRAANRRIEIVYQRGSIRKQMVDVLRRRG